MTKYKIIANPSAGSGKGKRSISQIEQLFERYKLDYDLISTERSWHAAELAKESALSGYDIVVAAGGDGTVNEVINGLMEAKIETAVCRARERLRLQHGNTLRSGASL